jgi:electron transfer flavoprotein alpha subunit
VVVRRCLARATRVIVAIYKNEEAPIFHRPTTGLSPISNEALSALEMALAGR